MSAPFMSVAAKTADINAAWRTAPPHLKPVFEAVRDFGAGLLIVTRQPGSFALPRGRAARPGIVLIGDDLYTSAGPDGFHFPSVRRAIRACSVFAVVSCEALPSIYAAVADTVAATRCNGMIVETQLQHELQWMELIQKLAPKKPLFLGTVRGGTA